MKKTIAIKIFYQLIIGTALSFLYMLYIKNISKSPYTLSWPFAALGGWFLLLGWFGYLRIDRLSIFHLDDKRQQQQEKQSIRTKFKLKSLIDYINMPIQVSPEFNKRERTMIKMISNLITAAIFFLLAYVC